MYEKTTELTLISWIISVDDECCFQLKQGIIGKIPIIVSWILEVQQITSYEVSFLLNFDIWGMMWLVGFSLLAGPDKMAASNSPFGSDQLQFIIEKYRQKKYTRD